MIRLTTGKRLECAENDNSYPAPITIQGYSGARITSHWEDFVIDIEGIKVEGDDPMPILLEHKRECLVGKVASITVNENLILQGEVYNTPSGQTVREAEKANFGYQASVGLDVVDVFYIGENSEAEVNGRMEPGPLCVVAKSVLKEISCVIWGLDSNTGLEMSQEDKELLMASKLDGKPKTSPSASVTPEHLRPATLALLTEEFSGESDFILKCLSDGITVVASRARFLDLQQARMAKQREEMEKEKKALAEEKLRLEKLTAAAEDGADPITGSDSEPDEEDIHPAGSITMARIHHRPCAEPFQTQKDLEMFSKYGGVSKLHGSFETRVAGWQQIPF